MNPQYAPQQSFIGIPPQGFPGNRASPSLGPPPTTQQFQNIPLGSMKPPQQPPGPPFSAPSPMNPPSSTPGQFHPNMGPPRSQIPPNQLPPSMGQEQRPPSGPPTQFGPPLTSNQAPLTVGQEQRPPNQFGPSPTLNHMPPPSGQEQRPPNQFGPSPTSSQLPPPAGPAGQEQRPPNQFGPPPTSNQMPPSSGQEQRPSNQFGPPPMSNQMPPPSGQEQRPPNQFGPSPTSGQMPPPLGQEQRPPNQFGPSPTSNQMPPPLGPEQRTPNQFGSPPTSTHLPPSLGEEQRPPNQFGPSSTTNPLPPPPTQDKKPLNGHLNQFRGPPPSNMAPDMKSNPSQFQNRPPHFQNGPGFGPQSSATSLPPQGPPPTNKPPGATILPPQVPQFGLPPRPGQPPIPGQNLSQPPFTGPLPLGNQPQASGQPPLSMMGQPLPNSQPPMPGQSYPSQPPNQFGQGPPGVMPPNRQFNQPPLPGQPPLGPNQLANQMQGMNLGGPRQFPGGPMKNAMNGDNGPHMPPPLNQQQYMNGQQQMRGPPGPGYPPMPGQQPTAAGLGAYPQPGYQQPQQAKRLDPDQMPSPIQVTQDDQQNRSGIFCTNQKGLVPPLVTTNFIVQDQGNASPRFIRSSMYNVPVSQDIMKQTAVPFSLVISPMARTVDQEYPPPIVNFGELGPVRCIRCKAYMCPYMQFIDSGRRFQCLFCKATTDVPTEYFQHLDHTGQRLDRYERPELVLGTYEFVATTEYCRNNTLPKPPAIIFVIDVSYNNIKSGLVHLLCSQIKEIIQHLPVDQGQEKSNMRVGFITYNSSVHFYNIKGNLAAPQMLIVGDIQEMFMPLLDGFLCTPEESGPVIDSLMQQIPAMFGDTRETETILLPAILAGLEALKASDCAGKLLVFHSTLPTAEGPGRLKNRDDRKLLGTDKEKAVLTPQTQAYNQLGQDCVGAGCSVDLFIFNNAYIDIATIGQVSRLTGGEVHKYTYFQADVDGDRLIKDIITDISRPIAFDAIMRVRTSTGVRPTDFYGHFYMSNTTDMELAAIDCDKAVAVEIKHDDKLSEEEGVYVQAALLYTSCSGQRRLRVINLSLKTCSQMSDLYRNCDCDTIINYISKQSTYKLYEHNPKAVKDNIVTRAAQILASYRKNCASPSSAGQLILPECMKLLPLYVNCLLKSDALSGGSDMTIDDRAYVMQEVMIMDIPTSVNYFYPRLIPLVDLDPNQDPVEMPAPIRCTIDKMNEQGVYILENGIHMFLWVGLGANPDFIQKVFGVPSAIQVDVEKVALPELDNPLSVAIRTIIEEIRIQRHKCMRLTIVRQREKLEPVFKHFLAEDRGTDGSPSYVDFLIHMHKEIRSLLS